MIKKEIAYRLYADKNGINRAVETEKGSYNAETKTIVILVGDAYDEELDDIILAYTSRDAFDAACVEDATDAEKDEAWKDRYNWFSEAFGWSERETDAILAVLA